MVLFSNSGGLLFGFANNFDAKVTFYTTENFYSKNARTIKNGNGYMVCCDVKDARQTFLLLNKDKINGQSFCFVGNENDFYNLLTRLNVSVVSKENLNSIIVVNGYNKKFPLGVFVGKDFVNIQLAFNKGIITVVCPVILGSY